MDRTHQWASQQSTSRPLWYQENTWTCCTKIRLANTWLWRWRLWKGMQCMPSLESSLAQAIRWLTILAGFYLSLKGLINGFCHGFANFDWLKKRQLWLNPCHCQPAHKDGLLQVSQGHYQYLGPCKSHHQRSGETSRPPRLNHHQPGVSFHLEVLVIAMLFPRHQAKTLYRLPPVNGRPDKEAE